VIRALLLLWFASQTISPEAARHMQAGIAADKQKQFDAAITEFKKVTELEPTFADGFVGLGQTYMEKHDFASAVTPLKRALEVDPDLAPAHQLLGYALLAQGYAAQAIPHLQKVQDKTGLGIAEIQTGQLPEAVANLQAALAERPNDQDLLYYLGRASGLLSKQSIDTLLAAYPDSARAHQALAENYFVLRQMPEAEKEYREALRLRPDTPELHLELRSICGRFPMDESRRRVSGASQAAARQRRGCLSSGDSVAGTRESARGAGGTRTRRQADARHARDALFVRKSSFARRRHRNCRERMEQAPFHREGNSTRGASPFRARRPLSETGENSSCTT